MSTILENVTAYREQAERDYAAMLNLAADGGTPDPRSVIDTLAVLGKPLDYFQRDLDKRMERAKAAADLRRANEQLTEADNLAMERNTLEKALADARAKAAKIVETAAKPLREIIAKESNLRADALKTRRDASAVLRATANPSIERELDALRRRRTEILHLLEVVWPHRPLDTIEDDLRRAKDKETDLGTKANAETEFDAVGQRIGRLEKELTEARKRSALCEPHRSDLVEVEAEMDRLERSKLEP